MTAPSASQTYGDYLALDAILDAQHMLSDEHDEMLFIIIHQNKELWLKQILYEVNYAMNLLRDDQFMLVHKALSRVSRIQTVMTLSWDILATLTPADYMKFRHVFGSASGFQSAQFREVEYRLGIKDPRYLANYAEGSPERIRLEEALHAPSLWEEAVAAVGRAGFPIGNDNEIRDAWLRIYLDTENYPELYGLAEKLVDLDDSLAAWRHKHILTVERIIGQKTGSGGSAGSAYLKTTLDKRAFPALWDLRTEI